MFCFLCCSQTTKNGFYKIKSIAENYRHEYLSRATDDDSVFFLVVFFEDSLGKKLLINANDVQIPHFSARPTSDMLKNRNPYKGYVVVEKNFLFVYDFTKNAISQEYLNSVKLATKLSKNKPLMKYYTDDYFLDSHTDIYSISKDFDIIKQE